MNHIELNNSLKIPENSNNFAKFINKKGPKPSFLNEFEIETEFRDGIFKNEYVVILKCKEEFFKIVAFYSSYYGVIFDESSKFVAVKPKLVTVTKFESITKPQTSNPATVI